MATNKGRDEQMASDKSELATVIDVIKNIFYVENPQRQFPEVIFEHPFNSQILLDESVDRPSQELIERVLNIGRENVGQNERIFEKSLDPSTINEETTTYLALPSEMKSHLRGMFMKPRLTVESKPRGSVERKLSSSSMLSLKRAQVTRSTKSRRSSKVSHGSRFSSDLQRTSEKRSSLSGFLDSRKDRRKSSVEKSISSTGEEVSIIHGRLSKSMSSKDLKSGSLTVDMRETDFFITPLYYNSLRELETAIVDDQREVPQGRNSKRDTFTWSKRENARRKVSGWLRNINAV